jgi:MFS family permease
VDETAIPESVDSTAQWPRSSVAYYTLFVLVLSTTSSQLDIAIVPYLASHIKADLHLSDTALQLLIGVSFALFYTLVGLPIGWLIDRYSRRLILTLGILTWSIGTALCGLAQNVAQLFSARFVVGAGEAVNGPACYAVLADLFPRDRLPRAVTLLQVGTMLGPAIALVLSGFVLHLFLDMQPVQVLFGVMHGWQLVFILVGAPGLLVALLIATTMRDTPRRVIRAQLTESLSERPTSLASASVACLKDFAVAFRYMTHHWRVFGPMFAALLAGSFSIGSLQWIPIFFERTFGWHPGKLAMMQGTAQFIVMPLGMFLGVALAEHFTRRHRSDAAIRVLIVARLIGLPGIFGVLVPYPWLAFGLRSLSYFTIGFGAPSQNAAMQIVTPAELRGKITALYLFIYSVLGVALAPVVNGLISDFVLHDESLIRWAIFWPEIIFNPLSLLIIWWGMKWYGREVMRLKALETAPPSA